jgi:hypothetical protein
MVTSDGWRAGLVCAGGTQRGMRRIAALLLGGLAVLLVPAPTWAAQAQGLPEREQAAESPPDARMLAELTLLRDLELLRQLDVLRKVDEPRRIPLPRATQEAKGKP